MDEDLPLILKAIEHAAVAGRCRVMARLVPITAPGLLRAAEKQHEDAAALLEEVCRCE